MIPKTKFNRIDVSNDEAIISKKRARISSTDGIGDKKNKADSRIILAWDINDPQDDHEYGIDMVNWKIAKRYHKVNFEGDKIDNGSTDYDGTRHG